MNSEIVYVTGATPDGELLLGGVWRMWHQEGFPIEMAYLHCRSTGCRIDWMEAMADASLTNNLPALMEQIEVFLDAETLREIKLRFTAMMRSGKTFEEIMAMKQARRESLKEAKP